MKCESLAYTWFCFRLRYFDVTFPRSGMWILSFPVLGSPTECFIRLAVWKFKTHTQRNSNPRLLSYVSDLSRSTYPHNSFVAIVIQPGTIVVNVGDLLSRWSNDILRSTLHRVVAPSKRISSNEQLTPARQSIAFFCNPNGGALIDCLPHCFGPGKAKKYEAVTTEDYIVRR